MSTCLNVLSYAILQLLALAVYFSPSREITPNTTEENAGRDAPARVPELVNHISSYSLKV